MPRYRCVRCGSASACKRPSHAGTCDFGKKIRIAVYRGLRQGEGRAVAAAQELMLGEALPPLLLAFKVPDLEP